tara:strand:+ start:150 stop:359 length:210 start_codon:yes stop_codon:yes gene_type:complete
MMFLKTLVVGEEVLLEPLSVTNLEDLQNPMEVVAQPLAMSLEAPLGVDLLEVLVGLLVGFLEEPIRVVY